MPRFLCKVSLVISQTVSINNQEQLLFAGDATGREERESTAVQIPRQILPRGRG